MFFNISGVWGLRCGWFATVWSTANDGQRDLGRGAGRCDQPILIFQVFANFDALATAFAVGAIFAWARRSGVAGALIVGVAAKLIRSYC